MEPLNKIKDQEVKKGPEKSEATVRLINIMVTLVSWPQTRQVSVELTLAPFNRSNTWSTAFTNMLKVWDKCIAILTIFLKT